MNGYASINDIDALSVLSQDLVLSSTEIRESIAEALRESNLQEASHILWKLVEDEQLSETAIDSLSARGDATIPECISILEAEDRTNSTKIAAIRILSSTMNTEALGYLLRFAKNAAPSLHFSVIEALSKTYFKEYHVEQTKKIVESEIVRQGIYPLYLKRIIDIIASAIILVISLPVIVIAAFLVKTSTAGPVIYNYHRIGKGGREFMVLKFRTMVIDQEEIKGPVFAAERDPRITSVGRLLRRFRIDEILSLLNVLKGDMSLVGPRPENPLFAASLQKEFEVYSQRSSVAPGLTGLAQVEYSYARTIEGHRRKLVMDLYYASHCSFFLDINILWRTMKYSLLGRPSNNNQEKRTAIKEGEEAAAVRLKRASKSQERRR